ncbi:MAG: hypothetical protein ABJ275_08470 [Maricaulaceae bacterium]
MASISLAIMLAACQDSAPSNDIAIKDVSTTSLHDMVNFSQELAGHVGLEIGFDRDSAEAEIRGYFGTTASTGQIPIFQSKKLEDGTFEIVATRNGLRDDSVKNEQLIARFSNNILTDYGMRVKCYRAADPEAWIKESCP